MDMSPTDVGYKFRSLALANCPTNSNLSRLVLKLWDTCGKFYTVAASHKAKTASNTEKAASNAVV